MEINIPKPKPIPKYRFIEFAYVQNVREQKHLERSLEDINRVRQVRVKQFAREKFNLLEDLIKINDSKKSLDYFDDDIHGEELKTYSDNILKERLDEEKNVQRNKFDFERTTEKQKLRGFSLAKDKSYRDSISSFQTGRLSHTLSQISLSRLEKHIAFFKTEPSYSPLKASKKEDLSEILPDEPIFKETASLPDLETLKEEDEYRELKQKMDEVSALSPVSEQAAQRKMSI